MEQLAVSATTSLSVKLPSTKPMLELPAADITLQWYRTCFRSADASEKVTPQPRQQNGRCPLCVLRWVFRLPVVFPKEKGVQRLAKKAWKILAAQGHHSPDRKKSPTFQDEIAGNMSNKCTFINPTSMNITYEKWITVRYIGKGKLYCWDVINKFPWQHNSQSSGLFADLSQIP